MTTILTQKEIERNKDIFGRYCEGCPRCKDNNIGFCKESHIKFNNLHPICRRCGHCVLRGKHNDDISDL